MTEQTWLERNGATPGKLAIVGALAVALVAIMWRNFAASDSPAETTNAHPKTLQAAVAAKRPEVAKQVPTQLKPKSTTRKVWPQYSLDQVANYDPLAQPMWYLMAQSADEGNPGASMARSAQVLEELKKQTTKIVVISGDERIATIGDLSFRVGDTVEGFQVTEITTDGIVLTELGR